MSTVRKLTLYCDAEGCDAEINVAPPDRTDLIRAAGWVRSGGQDLCPKHAEQR